MSFLYVPLQTQSLFRSLSLAYRQRPAFDTLLHCPLLDLSRVPSCDRLSHGEHCADGNTSVSPIGVDEEIPWMAALSSGTRTHEAKPIWHETWSSCVRELPRPVGVAIIAATCRTDSFLRLSQFSSSYYRIYAHVEV